MRYQNFYQACVIFFSLLVALSIGFFIYKEIFPEYKKYQEKYELLEEFRSSYTGEKPAPFSKGIQQIVIPSDNNGPEVIDRCTSCHLAMEYPHFSPLKVALDVNGQTIVDHNGNPVLETNTENVWYHLEKKIADLKNPLVLEELKKKGDVKAIRGRSQEVERLEELKSLEIDRKRIPLNRVLAMHPLILGEKEAFEFHSLENYGCTVCHSGNGRALVAKRAHGPVFDDDYEKYHEFERPQFIELDPENDPKFSKMYNDKPGHSLVFQTTPLLAGPLLQARCVECHQSSSQEMSTILNAMNHWNDQKSAQLETLKKGILHDEEALYSLLSLRNEIETKGYDAAVSDLNLKLGDFRLSSTEIDAYEAQLNYLTKNKNPFATIQQDLIRILGSQNLADSLTKAFASSPNPLIVKDFLHNKQNTSSEPESIFSKKKAEQGIEETLLKIKTAEAPLNLVSQQKPVIKGMKTNVDHLITNFNRGKELYISQACYACHRIAGFSRSSVGPELTRIGYSYPWYVKESIVWPQADLASSTMPNFRLDHEELRDLMTFLMAQKGETKSIAEIDYEISIKEWEAGAKMPWEEPISPTDIQNIRKGMEVFATEGCAACHKLEGFKSEIGFASHQPKKEMNDEEWFYALFPENIGGSRLAEVVWNHAADIDARIVSHARREEILEDIERKYPGLIEGFYANFKFATRRFDHAEVNSTVLAEYKARLRRVLMIYVQIYGLGRNIAPHLNWSGVFRNDAWLLGHFQNPSEFTPRSLMPVMPFDDTKFFALNRMLHILGRENRNKIQKLWQVKGFDPPLAYNLLCSTCHGEQRQGDGVVSEWIYPIPKNLRNADFLINLSKARAIESITHGVKGTPMPPWGETAPENELGDSLPVLTTSQIAQLADWLYKGIPSEFGGDSNDVSLKWSYMPSSIVEEMRKKRVFLKPHPQLIEHYDDQDLAAYYFVEKQPTSSRSASVYIRNEFYTEENIREGEAFFNLNCAVCHGKDAAGTGVRSTSMVEAKPRILTNLPWLRTRDDLRLLRSIKFGVPGTSMIPWGDQTSSKLRMQLVIYFRSLSKSQEERKQLQEILYEQFEAAKLRILEARTSEYKKLEEAEEAHLKAFQLRENLTIHAEESLFNSKEVSEAYIQEILLFKELEYLRKRDRLFVELSESLENEKKLYETLGANLIGMNLDGSTVEFFIALIRVSPIILTVEGGSLKIFYSKERMRERTQLKNQLAEILDEKIAKLQKFVDQQEKKRTADTHQVEERLRELGSYINLRTKFVTHLADAEKEWKQQLEIYQKINHGNAKTL